MDKETGLNNIRFNFDILNFIMSDFYDYFKNNKILDFKLESKAINCHPSYYLKFNISKKGKTSENKIRFSDHNQTSGFYAHEKQSKAYSLDVLAGTKNIFVADQSVVYNSNKEVYLADNVLLKEAIESFFYNAFYEQDLLNTDFSDYVFDVIHSLEFK